MSTPDFHSRLPGTPPGLNGLLSGVRQHSPYLSRLIDKFPAIIELLASSGAQPAMSHLRECVQGLAVQMPRADFSRELRQAKQQSHLVLALSELGQLWSTKHVMESFSDFAVDCINACMRHAFSRYRLDVNACGFFVIGFGKLAGRELNYSSDVDLAFFHDSHKLMQANVEPHKLVRAAREMVALLSEISEHGYAFRVDLRLRPDPASTPIVMSTEAALIYYESMGQTWERAAWIKARPLCGDQSSANDFIVQMQAFIWRRFRDFAAIDEIHRIRQRVLEATHSEAPGEPGYNVKTGPGGIREIELLAQTLQLIHGGREPELRVGPSLSALDKLAAAKLMAEGDVQQLEAHYFFLRAVEHALQMLDDQQTHVIPDHAEDSAHAAALCGYSSATAWQAEINHRAKAVLALVAAALPEREQSGENAQNPFALGENANARALEWLGDNGFQDPNSALHVIRGWQQGNIRATRSRRAEALLEEVLPQLMQAMADCKEPDHVLAKTARFFESLPAGVQLFSLIAHCPQLITRLVDVLGASQWMAQSLTGNPQLLDTLLRNDPDGQEAVEKLAISLVEAPDIESAMNLARRQVEDNRFRLGAQILGGEFNWRDIACSISRLADAAIAGLAGQVWGDMLAGTEKQEPDWAILGFGKLGSREMGLLSDLDLVMVFAPKEDRDEAKAASLAARFTRRLVSALSVPTEAGGLFEVDMALRPSGKSGPVAVSLSAFEQYYQHDAWVWEYLALTRARVVAASDAGFAKNVADTIPQLLAHCNPVAIAPELAHMRLRLAEEKPQRFFWDIKHGPGGMMDLDFLVQVRKLLHIADPETVSPAANAETEIRNLYHDISHVLAVTMGRDAHDMMPDEPAVALLLSQTQSHDLDELQARLRSARESVMQALRGFTG